jgi:hypothetical protein
MESPLHRRRQGSACQGRGVASRNLNALIANSEPVRNLGVKGAVKLISAHKAKKKVNAVTSDKRGSALKDPRREIEAHRDEKTRRPRAMYERG